MNYPRILLIDMNSFFASVEQQANPFLRGRPVGVCASLHETSTLIATSKEAKVLGIKTGTPIWKAKKIYPKIVVVEAEPEKYREVCQRLNRIYADYTDRVEAYSIDESFLEIDGLRINGLRIAAEIKQRIRDEVGERLTCSVGVAENKFLAKLASDMEKPDGLTMIWQSQLPEIYKTKKLSDLWGIGRGWTKRLARIGILTPLDLMNYPVGNLMALFGKPGYFLWERVNGLEINELRIADQKSFGNSWVLNFRTTDKEKLQPVIWRLAEKAARRMRGEGMAAYGIYLSVRLTSGEHLGTHKKLSESIDNGAQFYHHAMRLWASWRFATEVMHIACGFTHLAPKVNQLELKLNYGLTDYGFNSQSAIRNRPGSRQESLQESLDAINNKYGEFTIRSGLIARTADFAPDSIAFGK